MTCRAVFSSATCFRYTVVREVQAVVAPGGMGLFEAKYSLEILKRVANMKFIFDKQSVLHILRIENDAT